jgi:hypothetical protein
LGLRAAGGALCGLRLGRAGLARLAAAGRAAPVAALTGGALAALRAGGERAVTRWVESHTTEGAAVLILGRAPLPPLLLRESVMGMRGRGREPAGEKEPF